MKNISAFYLFCVGFLALSCSPKTEDITPEVVLNPQSERLSWVESMRSIKSNIGYFELLLDQPSYGSAAKWKELRDRVITEYHGSPYLRQLEVDIIQHLITQTDFLTTSREKDVEYVLGLFEHFDTKGGIKAKYDMLQFLKKHLPGETIKNMTQTAYDQGKEYRVHLDESLSKFTSQTQFQKLSFEDELALKSITNNIEEVEQYLPLLNVAGNL